MGDFPVRTALGSESDQNRGSATIQAMTGDKQTESQPLQQNNDPKPARTLTDADIHELISFFQLLDEWDREAKALESCKKTEDAR